MTDQTTDVNAMLSLDEEIADGDVTLSADEEIGLNLADSTISAGFQNKLKRKRSSKTGSGCICAVAKCANYNNKTGLDSAISFHRFPKERIACSRWMQLCRRKDGHLNPKNARICSSHFIPEDFNGKRLKPTAVPSIFTCLPAPQQPLSASKSSRRTPAQRIFTIKEPKRKNVCCQTDFRDQASLESEIVLLKESLEKLSLENQQFKWELELSGAKQDVLKNSLQEWQEKYEKEVLESAERLKRQEFRVEKFAGCDVAVQRLTGIPTFAKLEEIFNTFVSRNNLQLLDTIEITQRSEEKYPDRSIKGRRKMLSLNYLNQYFLCLLKLRTGMTDDIIGAIFGLSRQTASAYYNAWIRVLDETFRNCFAEWPERNNMPPPTSPKIAALFPKVDLIVDCFEIRIQTPKNPDAARKCWSNYKKGYTVKVLVGVETDGNAAFISLAYQGAISDIDIVHRSNLFSRLKDGDVVLADRGFQLGEYAKVAGVQWIVPPSKKGDAGFLESETRLTYQIARVRILVERWIGRMKKWKKLDGPIMIQELQTIDMEIRVVASLCKFLPNLINQQTEDGPDAMSQSHDALNALSAEQIFFDEEDEELMAAVLSDVEDCT